MARFNESRAVHHPVVAEGLLLVSQPVTAVNVAISVSSHELHRCECGN